MAGCRGARRPFVALMAAACLMLAACDDDITAAVRGTVAEAGGVEEAHDELLERARSGNGRDIYVLYWFLLMYVPIEPRPEFADWPYKSDDDLYAVLNCSAEAGYSEARRRAPLVGEQADEVRACLKTYGIRTADAWTRCGADRLLPECPLF